jgi:hypothetical protein
MSFFWPAADESNITAIGFESEEKCMSGCFEVMHTQDPQAFWD